MPRRAGRLALLLTVLFVGLSLGSAVAQTAGGDQPGPLAPPDISSPRATLQTFFDSVKSSIDHGRAGNRIGMRDEASRGFRAMNMEVVLGDAGFI